MLHEIQLNLVDDDLEFILSPAYCSRDYVIDVSLNNSILESYYKKVQVAEIVREEILRQTKDFNYVEDAESWLDVKDRPKIDVLLKDSELIGGLLEELEEFCNELDFNDLALCFGEDCISLEYGDFLLFTEYGNLQSIIENLIEHCKKYEELQELQKRLEALIC